VKVYVVSDRLDSVNGILKMKLINFNGNKLWGNEIPVKVSENSSKVYFSIRKSELLSKHSLNDIVFSVKFDVSNGSEYKNIYYFVPSKDMLLPHPDFEYNISGAGDSITVYLKANNLVKNVHVDIYTPLNKNVPSPLDIFTNDYFDMLPGDRVTISCGEKLDISSEIKIRTLTDTY
jgi:beta-mannosidase